VEPATTDTTSGEQSHHQPKQIHVRPRHSDTMINTNQVKFSG
jgi:hypothetical protein